MLAQYIIGIGWGIIVGFMAAVPIGPVGIICFQRTLAKSRISGLITGFGSSCADVLLASVGAFSITIIYSFISDHHVLLRTLGGVFLLILGIIGYFSKQKVRPTEADTALGAIEEFISGFVLTITNPLGALVFFVAFANLSNKIGGSVTIGTSFVIGIFIGTTLWWLLLTYVASRVAYKIKHEHFQRMNRIFSVIIILFGILILSGIVLRYLV